MLFRNGIAILISVTFALSGILPKNVSPAKDVQNPPSQETIEECLATLKQYGGSWSFERVNGGGLMFKSNNMELTYNPETHIIFAVSFNARAAIPPTQHVSIESITGEVNKKVKVFWPGVDFSKYTVESDSLENYNFRNIRYTRFIDGIDSGNFFDVTVVPDLTIIIVGYFCDESVVKQKVLVSKGQAVDIAVQKLKGVNAKYDVRNAKITAVKKAYIDKLFWHITIEGVLNSENAGRRYDYYY